jgi:hypothetical protein
MLFSEEDAPMLKKWIVKRLENTSVSLQKHLYEHKADYYSLTGPMQMPMSSQTMSLRFYDMMEM